MKYILMAFLFLFPMFGTAYADNSNLVSQMLDAQIERLEQELASKQKQLEQCQGTTKKLKITGGVTLATTTVGAAANVALAAKLKKKGGGAGAAGMPKDNRSQEEKDCSACAMFISAALQPLPDECAGC